MTARGRTGDLGLRIMAALVFGFRRARTLGGISAGAGLARGAGARRRAHLDRRDRGVCAAPAAGPGPGGGEPRSLRWPWSTFRHITFPAIRNAIVGSALLVFTLSMDEIAVTFFLIGRQNTLPLHSWGLRRRGITPEVNAAAAVIFVLSVGVIALWAALTRDDRGI